MKGAHFPPTFPHLRFLERKRGKELCAKLRFASTPVSKIPGGSDVFRRSHLLFLKEKQAKELCAKLRFASAPVSKVFRGSDVFRRSHFLRECLPPQKEVFSPEKWVN